MLTCEQALELISAQLDGALTAEEAGALDEHLAQCPACRALRADLWPRCWCLYWWAGRLCTSGALRTAPGAYPEPILPG